MKKCMETDKPLISILMAVYEPRMDWLKEQLDSLNTQTYPNLRLYVRDDCSPTVAFDEIKNLVKQSITAFPYTIERNEKNLGSNGTFERLTREAEGAYFAYCDQDDVWLAEKLDTLCNAMDDTKTALVCSDVIPINSFGEKLGESIREYRPRHILKSGPDLSPDLIYRNFVIGCTMLIRAEVAKEALPFAKSMVHDHYLAFFCALEYRITSLEKPLILYRLHANNQTGVLAHIQSKEDYVEKHLKPFCNRAMELSARFNVPELKQAKEWANAREANVKKEKGSIRHLWAMRELNKSTTLFEIIGLRLPSPLFRLVLRQIQKGRV